jgi:UDP-N-acetylmuramoyl-tripeptide--D-alanyl-D-alanine ligase
VNKLLYKLQLCGYKNRPFLKIAGKAARGAVKNTARIKRLRAAVILLCILGIGLPLLFLPRTVAAANTVMLPVENAIKRKWTKLAVKKLRQPQFAGLVKIGITGSYGKTTVKNILHVMLSSQYKVLSSPDSFNTPLGFAKTVNRHLTGGVQVLIMEMGARHRGDIAEMCRLLRPDHGIITAIGPCHLETFGDIETIKRTKYELFDAIPEGGIKIDAAAETFYETKLLGRHNQRNIALCAEFARRFGITEDNIKSAVCNLKPVPHRLELIESTNGIKVLDDGYNSNPHGAECALEVLSAFNGRKAVQTPGFAEQGVDAYKLNFKFGVQIAAAADAVIIMGELNKASLYDGLMSAGYPPEKIYFAAAVEDAKRIYPHILRTGDALLIENDLPENY